MWCAAPSLQRVLGYILRVELSSLAYETAVVLAMPAMTCQSTTNLSFLLYLYLHVMLVPCQWVWTYPADPQPAASVEYCLSTVFVFLSVCTGISYVVALQFTTSLKERKGRRCERRCCRSCSPSSPAPRPGSSTPPFGLWRGSPGIRAQVCDAADCM